MSDLPHDFIPGEDDHLEASVSSADADTYYQLSPGSSYTDQNGNTSVRYVFNGPGNPITVQRFFLGSLIGTQQIPVTRPSYFGLLTSIAKRYSSGSSVAPSLLDNTMSQKRVNPRSLIRAVTRSRSRSRSRSKSASRNKDNRSALVIKKAEKLAKKTGLSINLPIDAPKSKYTLPTFHPEKKKRRTRARKGKAMIGVDPQLIANLANLQWNPWLYPPVTIGFGRTPSSFYTLTSRVLLTSNTAGYICGVMYPYIGDGTSTACYYNTSWANSMTAMNVGISGASWNEVTDINQRCDQFRWLASGMRITIGDSSGGTTKALLVCGSSLITQNSDIQQLTFENLLNVQNNVTASGSTAMNFWSTAFATDHTAFEASTVNSNTRNKAISNPWFAIAGLSTTATVVIDYIMVVEGVQSMLQQSGAVETQSIVDTASIDVDTASLFSDLLSTMTYQKNFVKLGLASIGYALADLASGNHAAGASVAGVSAAQVKSIRRSKPSLESSVEYDRSFHDLWYSINPDGSFDIAANNGDQIICTDSLTWLERLVGMSKESYLQQQIITNSKRVADLEKKISRMTLGTIEEYVKVGSDTSSC
jgi:hypothetical protein